MTNSEQLERESEQARARLEDTLDELRQRITPGQIIDQVFGYAGNGQIASWVNTLGRKAMENPLPVAMLGASMAWLMATRGNGHAPAARPEDRDDGTGFGRDLSMEGGSFGAAGDRVAEGMSDSATEGARGTVGSVVHGVRAAAEGMAGAVGSAATTVGDAAEGVADAARRTAAYVGDHAGSAYHGATSGIRRAADMVGNTASEVGHGASRTSRSVIDFCTSQPLVLAGIGLAIGAAIGAAFRSTEAENRLVGDAADEVKSQAQKLASAPVEAVKSAFGGPGGDGNGSQGSTAQDQGAGSFGQGGQTDWRSRPGQAAWAPGKTGSEASRQAYQSDPAGQSGQMSAGQTMQPGQSGAASFGVPASEDAASRSDRTTAAADKRSAKDETSGMG